MLTEGQTVTIKVKNIMWPIRHRYGYYVGPEIVEYTGTVMRQKWFKPDQIGLTTGDPNHPFRVINIERIVEVGGFKVDYSETENKTITKTVQGSKGATYVVTKNGNNVHCTCPGFSFRKSCRHINEVV